MHTYTGHFLIPTCFHTREYTRMYPHSRTGIGTPEYTYVNVHNINTHTCYHVHQTPWPPRTSGSICHYTLQIKQLTSCPRDPKKQSLPSPPRHSPAASQCIGRLTSLSAPPLLLLSALPLPPHHPSSFHRLPDMRFLWPQTSAGGTGVGKNNSIFSESRWPFPVSLLKVPPAACWGSGFLSLVSLLSPLFLSPHSQRHCPAFTHLASGPSREQGSNVILGRAIYPSLVYLLPLPGQGPERPSRRFPTIIIIRRIVMLIVKLH